MQQSLLERLGIVLDESSSKSWVQHLYRSISEIFISFSIILDQFRERHVDRSVLARLRSPPSQNIAAMIIPMVSSIEK